MNFLRSSAVLLLSCASVAGFSQSATPAPAPSAPATPSAPVAPAPASAASRKPVDLTGFREHIEEKNKVLTDEVINTKAIVKKNTTILQQAKRIDADNKRLAAERKALEAQNAEFARQSQAIQSETTGVTVPTPPPAAPVRVEPVVPAPAKVEPAPPARVDTAVSVPAATTQSVPPVKSLVQRTGDASAFTIAESSAAPLARPSVVEAPPVARVAVEAVDTPVRVSSGVSQGMLLTPITPVYPRIAVTAHVEGEVVLEAIISKEGNIATVRAVSGPSMLRQSALDAIKIAHYRPYRVDGQLVEVAATIRVVFQLGH